ncbi:MAG: molybdopterin biosynthesis protein [Deltaproteobacteria bacterium]|nr:molybdopterin biosynthesis protein [Candidatus Zymogenaceae bacterium]
MSKPKRDIYLEKTPLDEALDLLVSHICVDDLLGEETIPTGDASGRVTSKTLFAKISSPHYHSAAMDGVAVDAKDTLGATESSPLVLTAGDGKDYQAVYINTGAPLPEDKNAVIMIEDVDVLEDGTIEIVSSALPYQHVRAVGEDTVATEPVVGQGRRLRPYDVGALISAGHAEIPVKKRPVVTLIPTGSEIIEPTDTPPPVGKVFESNTAVISALLKEDGADPRRCDITPDDPEMLRNAVLTAAASSDMVIVLAGSSAGSRDYTRSIIESLGTVIVHGIAMMPGKPTILGAIGGKPVIGLPGYPVSAILSYRFVIRPLIHRMLGLPVPVDDTVPVTVLRDIPKKTGNEELLRVHIAEIDKRLVASPLPRGAGNITTMVRADGIIRTAAMSEGLKKGDTAPAILLKPKTDIMNAVMIIGSHDISLDLLSSLMGSFRLPVSLASVNVGSLGGIMALKNSECHMAGSHLLDEKTGEYNIPAIKKYLTGHDISLVTLAHRQQGLIVKKNNPLGIRDIADLLRDDVVFVNRQRGSGTRILLDYLLKAGGMDASDITGYDREEFTHMNVAVRIASGRADCGLGIQAAATALDLDFIPVEEERYDLVIPKRHLSHSGVASLLEIIASPDFITRLEALGGYSGRDTGKDVPLAS